jgi:hypothetical protein
MVKMGHRHPEWNRPMLLTREMVMLRDKADSERLKTYAKLDEKGRRKFLSEKIARLHDYKRLEIDNDAYDVAEWFAAPMDMAHALNWLRLHTREKDPAHPLRAILAMNPTLKVDSKVWPYMGDKGGNEEKLIAGNWLLRHRNGKWYTFHVYWNSKEKIDKETIIKAAQSILSAIEGEIK